MEGPGDSFEYLLQLTKTLSSYALKTRQETAKVEQSLKRLAKQNHISYNEYCKEPKKETLEKYEQLQRKSDEEKLIEENFELIYQIQQEEYFYSKICTSIHQIEEMVLSVRNFIAEQRVVFPKVEEEFLTKNLDEDLFDLQNSLSDSKDIRENCKDKLDIVINDLVALCKKIPWNSFRKDDPQVIRILKDIKRFEKENNLKILPKLPVHLDCFLHT